MHMILKQFIIVTDWQGWICKFMVSPNGLDINRVELRYNLMEIAIDIRSCHSPHH